MSKSFRTYFGVTRAQPKCRRTTLQQVGVKKPGVLIARLIYHAGFRDYVYYLGSCITRNAISMIYAISGPLIAMILFIAPTLSTYLDNVALKPYCSVGTLNMLVVGLLWVVRIGDVFRLCVKIAGI